MNNINFDNVDKIFKNFKTNDNKNFFNVIKNKIILYQKMKKVQNEIIKPKFENKKSEKIYDKINDKYSNIKEIEKYNLKNFDRILKEKKSLLLGNENNSEFHKIKLIEFFMEKIQNLKIKNIIKKNVPLFKTKPKPFKLSICNSSDYILNSYNNYYSSSVTNHTNNNNKNSRNSLIKNKHKFSSNNLKIKNIKNYLNVSINNNIYNSCNNISNYVNYNKNLLNYKFKNIIDNIDITNKSSSELQKEIISFEKIKKNFSNDDIKKINNYNNNKTIETNKSNNSNYNFPKIKFKYKNPKITKYIQLNKKKIEQFSKEKKVFKYKKFNFKINI